VRQFKGKYWVFYEHRDCPARKTVTRRAWTCSATNTISICRRLFHRTDVETAVR
jgi:hypothetical protein